jgi:aspartate racemase
MGATVLDQCNGLTRKRIGIIAGAGPEAGIDLWQKILEANKASLGASFGGDMDAPDVTVFSIPRLGLAMEIERNEELIWTVLKDAILAQADRVDVFCIACNVLHYYSDRINALGLRAEFVSIVHVVRDYLSENHVKRAALLSIGKVVQLGKWSPYAALCQQTDFEIPADADGLTRIVADVKKLGPDADGVRQRFSHILASMQSQVVLLACTELPLVASPISGKILVDVTRLLAEAMVRKSLGAASPQPSHYG